MHAWLINLMLTLAWRPFLDPLWLPGRWLWLLLFPPIAVAIAIVYKTIKLPDLSRLPIEVARLSAMIVGFMAAIGLIVWLIAEVM